MVGLCCERVWLWLALRVWWVRESCASEDLRDCRCCERNCDRVESESLMRRSEAVSLAILKCEVHCEMSWAVVSVLYYTMLYYIVMCCAVLLGAVLRCSVLRCLVLRCAVERARVVFGGRTAAGSSSRSMLAVEKKV